ncbi:MAG TPA: hypothetical protein VLY04_24160 [Bryobacteraceae bacterium]|nr:hypothetical protein [Bryobacteraceae bacterium]
MAATAETVAAAAAEAVVAAAAVAAAAETAAAVGTAAAAGTVAAVVVAVAEAEVAAEGAAEAAAEAAAAKRFQTPARILAACQERRPHPRENALCLTALHVETGSLWFAPAHQPATWQAFGATSVSECLCRNTSPYFRM